MAMALKVCLRRSLYNPPAFKMLQKTTAFQSPANHLSLKIFVETVPELQESNWIHVCHWEWKHQGRGHIPPSSKADRKSWKATQHQGRFDFILEVAEVVLQQPVSRLWGSLFYAFQMESTDTSVCHCQIWNNDKTHISISVLQTFTLTYKVCESEHWHSTNHIQVHYGVYFIYFSYLKCRPSAFMILKTVFSLQYKYKILGADSSTQV